MRVAIIGAGVAGLSAARALARSGHQPVVFEKSDHVGGRVATRQIEGYRFDSGASGITPRGGPLESVLHEFSAHELVKIERPIYVHNGFRVSPGDAGKNRLARYTFRSGNIRLAEHLAQGIDVRLRSPIESLIRDQGSMIVLGERFEAAILTPPIPQTSTLLWSIGESRPTANAKYRPCLSVMLGFERPIETSYHALLDPEQRHPLTWLSIESVKSPDRAPNGCSALVAQLSSWYSLAHFSDTSERIVGDTLAYVARLIGKGFETPAVAEVKRWKYAQPDSVALFDTVNHTGSRLVVAGDGVIAGRIENAFESGLRAARLLDSNISVITSGAA